MQAKVVKFIQKNLCVLLLCVFVCMVTVTSFTRLANMDRALTDTGDYSIMNVLLKAVGSGVSPLSITIHYYYGAHCYPYKQMYHILTTLTLAPVVAVGVPAELTTYVVMPIAFSIILSGAILFFVRTMKYNEPQAAVFTLALIFVNDWALPSFISTPGSEVVGISFGLAGIAFLKKNENSRSAIMFILSVLSHIFDALTIAILGLAGIITSILDRKANLSKFIVFIPAIIAAGLLMLPYIVPMTTNDAIHRPTNLNPYILCTPTPNNTITHVTEKITRFITGSATTASSQYFRLPDWVSYVKLLVYPITYPYWNSAPRYAVEPTLSLLGRNLTSMDIANLEAFHLTPETILPICIILLFGCGVPVLFVSALWFTKNRDDRILLLSAYLVPVLYTLLPIGVFPDRSVLYTTLFLCVILAQTKIKDNPWFWALGGIVIIRSVLWTVMIVNNGGYGF